MNQTRALWCLWSPDPFTLNPTLKSRFLSWSALWVWDPRAVWHETWGLTFSGPGSDQRAFTGFSLAGERGTDVFQGSKLNRETLQGRTDGAQLNNTEDRLLLCSLTLTLVWTDVRRLLHELHMSGSTPHIHLCLKQQIWIIYISITEQSVNWNIIFTIYQYS